MAVYNKRGSIVKDRQQEGNSGLREYREVVGDRMRYVVRKLRYGVISVFRWVNPDDP